MINDFSFLIRSFFQTRHMANSTRRRLSFVDLAHPQVWHKLLEYNEATVALAKLSQ
jgi:hypothetical protein